MVRRHSRAIGLGAERRAADFLTGQGLDVVERNYRCRLGEIDLIMRDDDHLVFVEVRFRGGRRISQASLTVDTYKQRKLVRTAALYLAHHVPDPNSIVRFDVVAIDEDARSGQTIEWIRDAFRPEDSSL